jgi:DNA end-binding protein Ku
LSLAKQLIEGNTSKLNLSEYKDDYAAAVKKLVDAKRKGKRLPEEKPEKTSPKVVNIMDALRDSLAQEKQKPKAKKRSHLKESA